MIETQECFPTTWMPVRREEARPNKSLEHRPARWSPAFGESRCEDDNAADRPDDDIQDDAPERRSQPRLRIGQSGLVALDEHTTIGCMVEDLSSGGVRITLPDTAPIPDIFVLTAPCLTAAMVCRVVWRGEETIGARFQD